MSRPTTKLEALELENRTLVEELRKVKSAYKEAEDTWMHRLEAKEEQIELLRQRLQPIEGLRDVLNRLFESPQM